jgi:hypothetical protein
MNILGEHGSNKSTLSRTVKSIIDPSGENNSSMPKNPSDLVLHMFHRYLVNFDNVSGFKLEISDILCRAITGDGQSKRQLYTDQDEVILNYRRKIIINGIAPTLEFMDYRDRSIFYETLPMKDYERLTEEEYNNKFNELLPFVLGKIFEILQKMLNLYNSVKEEIKGPGRMADFTVMGECISRGLGYEPFSFSTSYKERTQISTLDIIESNLIVPLIEKLMTSCEKYEKPVSEFLKEIKQIAAQEGMDIDSRGVQFPRQPNKVRQHLQRLKPMIRELGYEVEIQPYNARDGKHARGRHIIFIEKVGRQGTLLQNFDKVPLSSLPPLSNQNCEGTPSNTDICKSVLSLPVPLSENHETLHKKPMAEMTDVADINLHNPKGEGIEKR